MGQARITATVWEDEPAWLVTVRDVTEQRTAERTLREHDQHLERIRRMEAIGLLAGGVAHEFNNLLMVIKGFTELAMLHRNDPDRVGNDLVRIRVASQRAAEITTQLLTLSRRSTLPPQRVILGPLMEETHRLLRPLLGERVVLEMVVEVPEAAVMVDPGEVQQVIMNLAINARDAMESVGRLQIGLRPATGEAPIAQEGDWVELWVRDDGVGMDEHTLTRAIEPFFTTKAVGAGTGLGLSTVFGIAQSWGATFHLESTPTHGTTASLYIPRLPARPAPAPLPARTRTTTTEDAVVLIVEDEPAVREFLLEALQDCYQLRLAAGPDEALAIFATARVDLMLTDVVMPGMSGPELHAELSRRGEAPPVIYISGYPQRQINAQLDAGISYLQKPLSADQLIEAIQATLKGESDPA